MALGFQLSSFFPHCGMSAMEILMCAVLWCEGILCNCVLFFGFLFQFALLVVVAVCVASLICQTCFNLFNVF